MANKKSYNRYFIIFQEEDKGYGIAIDKQPTGYTKIETRGGKAKVTVYAQNLIKEKGPYTCCLIDATKNPAVLAKLGEIKIDDTGRGETWWEYKEDDIANTGVPVDRFNVAAVTAGGENMTAPLAGYIGKDRIVWKEKIASLPRKQEKTEEPVDENKEAASQDAEDKVREENEELNEEAKKFKAYEEEIKKENKEGEAAVKTPFKGQIIKDEMKEEIKDKDVKKADVSKAVKPAAPSAAKPVEKKENKEEVKAEEAKNPAPFKGQIVKDEKKDEKKDEVKSEEVKRPAPFKGQIIKDEKKDEAKSEEAKKPAPFKGQIIKDEKKDEAKKEGALPIAVKPGANENKPEAETYYTDENIGENEDLIRKHHKKDTKYARGFHSILANFEEVEDISDELKGYRWWKIPLAYDMPLKQSSQYPYYSAIYHLKMAYPYINYIKCFKKCGYYNFGLKYDSNGEVKYIVYGIEGKNSIQEQPYMGMTGFVKWVPYKGKDTGMWLMYYNPYSGCIMIPKKR